MSKSVSVLKCIGILSSIKQVEKYIASSVKEALGSFSNDDGAGKKNVTWK